MAPVPGLTVNVGTVTAVRSVKESILVSTVPFGPQRHMFSPRGLLPLRGENARGIETVTKISTSPVNNVNNVQFCRSSSLSHSLFPVPVNVVASSAHIPPASSRPRDPLLKPPFPVRAWLPVLVNKIWSFLLGSPPLMFKNCGMNFVSTLTKSKWIM